MKTKDWREDLSRDELEVRAFQNGATFGVGVGFLAALGVLFALKGVLRILEAFQ